MFDETLLDDPEALTRADPRGLLRDAAGAGARVRTAARLAAEAGITELRPDGRPRTVLIAGPGTAATATADLLGTLAGGACPVVPLGPTGVAAAAGALRWTLPGWAGPVDLLLIATPDGGEPGLALLAEQAYRRGCTVVAVAPDRTPVTEAVQGAHGLAVPMATAPGELPEEEPVEAYANGTTAASGAFWALLTPLLLLLGRTGLVDADTDAVHDLADRLDTTAERCGPAVAAYSNPAKTLAAELAESLPLVWTEGPGAGPIGRRFTALLAEVAGHPALTAALPEALPAHGALLVSGIADASDPDDFFRDRVDEAEPLRARVVLLRDRPPGGLTAAPAARELALAHNTALSELEPGEGSDLAATAELIATTDFAAVYLALATTPRS